MKRAVLCTVVLLMGCAGSFEEARLGGRSYRQSRQLSGLDPQTPSGIDCAAWDRRHVYWQGLGTTFGALGGASGLGSIAVKDDEWRLGLQIGSVTSAAIALGAEVVAREAENEWIRYCSGDEATK